MYSTKHRCNKAEDIHGNVEERYITINDQYVDNSAKLPPRWKEKQFTQTHHAQNAGGGYFGHNGKPFAYVPEPFTEMTRYLKTEPLDTRKNGFGTRDASRRGEFTATIRTEQYRETLKKELRLMNKLADPEKARELVDKLAAMPRSKLPANMKETEFLYDIGRSHTTEFDPKARVDTFYRVRNSNDPDMRLGPYRRSSSMIGEGAWKSTYTKPEHGHTSPMKNFNDRSHLQVTGF